jgi:hypothetical protein
VEQHRAGDDVTICDRKLTLPIDFWFLVNIQLKGMDMKNWFLVFLTALLVSALPRCSQGQLTFTTNNGAITITRYTGSDGNVMIPASTNGYPVTGISSGAFPPGNSVASVTIPNSITNIGNGAFANSGRLTNITVVAGNPKYTSTNGVLFSSDMATLIQFPAGLGGSYAIPGGVTNIGADAFQVSGLTNVDIPNSVISIGFAAFNASGLTSVTIPNGVASIGARAFSTCSSLANVTIGNGVTNIGANAFSECSSLTNIAVNATNADYASMDGVLFDKTITTLIQYPSGLRAGNYAITNSVAKIGDSAFTGSLLTAITIPNSVTNIGSFAFQDCSRLTNITVAADNPSYASASGVMFNKGMTLLIQCPAGVTGSYVIPNSVTCIGSFAFEYCSGLTSVTIPNNVTNIGTSAFAICGLHQAYFQGNAPLVGSADTSIFYRDSGTVFCQPGTTGWGATFGGWPVRAGTYQPQPQMLGSGCGFGASSNGFKFTISWATNTSVVVLASTNLQNWTPVVTNSLVNGTNAFKDSTWTNYPQRFYRVRSH